MEVAVPMATQVAADRVSGVTARRFLGGMFLVNLILAVSTALVCLVTSGRGLALGVVTGGLIGAVNLFLLGAVVVRLLTPGARKVVPAILLAIKFVVLMAALLLVIKVLGLNVVGLAVGFSTTVVAVFISSAVAMARGRGISI